MTKYVLEVWSVRRFRAWRRGLMQPIWQVVSSIRPLQFAQGLGDKIVRTWCCRGCGRRALGFMKRRRGETPHSYIRRD